MEQGVSFRFLGFPVNVGPGFFLVGGIVLIFGLQAQRSLAMIAAFTAVIFVSILVHELGHAFVTRYFEVPVGGIFIHGFGGHVTHGPATVGQQLAISLAGPFAGLLLGVASFGVLLISRNEFTSEVMVYSTFVNVFWSLFNLLPIYPMDGGHALLASLHFITAPKNAAIVTFGLGSVLGVLVAIAGWQMGFIFVTLFAGSFAYQNVQLFRRIRGVTPAAEG
ncbi:MAG: hypothetical protein R3F61_16950 [Myxococcota bacterium]